MVDYELERRKGKEGGKVMGVGRVCELCQTFIISKINEVIRKP